MATLGIIGGIAPASTIDYYRLIIDEYRERKKDGNYPSIVINSINLTRLLALVGAGRLDDLASFLLAELDRLARAGADLALFGSNTPHIIFPELARRSPIPLISIVEATGDAASELGLKRVGILGTRYTMEGDFYPAVFGARGITVLRPRADDTALVHERYLGEIALGVLRPEVRAEFEGVIARLRDSGAEGVLLAGTELPPLLRGTEAGIPLLDTTRYHASRAVTELLKRE